jgi:hypothetical protein
VLAAVFAWALFVPAADWLARHDVGSAKGNLQLLQTARDAARGRLLTLGAGLAAAGALLFTARNFFLSREGQVTDRYTKAIEQLGSDKLDVRIGGIYALERVARDSARDHPAVMEVLAAFIREHSHEQRPVPEHGTASRSPERTHPDVQASITVIGRRVSKNDRETINLRGAELTGADLRHADLTGAHLNHAHLDGAHFREAHLRSAQLWSAHLNGAGFQDADLSGAVLTSAKLQYAKLAGADLSRADLVNADLDCAQLTGANLSGADLTGANIAGAQVAGANLEGASWPEEAPPQGWRLDIRSGRLTAEGADAGTSEVS